MMVGIMNPWNLYLQAPESGVRSENLCSCNFVPYSASRFPKNGSSYKTC